MFNLKEMGRLALTAVLAAGLYGAVGLDSAEAGERPPPPSIIYSEGGFDFSVFDLTDGFAPAILSGFGGPLGAFPETFGVLGMCAGCEDGSPNILSITRSDGVPFSLTGLVGASFPDDLLIIIDPTGDEPPIDDEPDTLFGGGLPIAVGAPFGPPLAGGTLSSGIMEFHEILLPEAFTELWVFALPPEGSPGLEDPAIGDCLCFDSMTFEDDSDSDIGPRLAAVSSITVTFNNVPEPAALSLLGLGFAGLALMRRRRAAGPV